MTSKKLREEFSKIYDAYIEKIYRFVFLKVNSQEVAEDLTSKTFLQGWEAFRNQGAKKPGDGGIEGSKNGRTEGEGNKKAKIENPRAFLYQIAQNLVIDYYRKEGGADKIFSENYVEIADPGSDLESKAQTQLEMGRIRKALFCIKEDYQKVIIWRYLDELSISEIAEMLGKTNGAIRVMLHRALKALRRQLADM